jgi:hypothetical protein
LIFNCQADKQPDQLLAAIAAEANAAGCQFDYAVFVPSAPTQLTPGFPPREPDCRGARRHCRIWEDLQHPLDVSNTSVQALALAGNLGMLQLDTVYLLGRRETSLHLRTTRFASTCRRMYAGDHALEAAAASCVHHSLATVFEAVGKTACAAPLRDLHVFIVGSFYLVGDALRMLDCEPP